MSQNDGDGGMLCVYAESRGQNEWNSVCKQIKLSVKKNYLERQLIFTLH